MRKYDELSQAEKEELEEYKLNAYIDYELMELGSTPEPNEQKPIYPNGVKFQKFYQVGSFLFETPKKAEALIALKPLTETYDYNIGYNVKFAREKANDELKIEIVELPTQESIMEYKEQLTEYNHKYNEWESKKNRNDRYEQNRLKTINRIRGDFNKIQQIKQDRELITKPFEEYKTLAINDDAALTFLVKTFGKERVAAIGIEVQEEET